MNQAEQRILLDRVAEQAASAERNKMVPMKGIVEEVGAGAFEGMVRIRRFPHEEPGAPARPFYYCVGAVPALGSEVWAHANFATGFVYGDFVSPDPAEPGVDGLMGGADKTKLDAIEEGATADQTPTEIRDALLTVDGALSGVDADLLDGVQGSGYVPSSHVGSGGSAHANATPSVAGFHSPTDKTKLDGIETGATTDQTPTEIRNALLGVDGAGSGVDADLLDGLHGSVYALESHTHNNAVPNGAAGFFSGADKHKLDQMDPLPLLHFTSGDQSLINNGHHELSHGLGVVPRFVFCQVRENSGVAWKIVAEGIAGDAGDFSVAVDAVKFYIDNREGFTVIYRIFAWV